MEDGIRSVFTAICNLFRAMSTFHQENLSIKRLDVSWNGFGNEGSLAMAEALKFNSTLQWLDMSNNRIADEGALLISKGLEVNDSLKILKVINAPVACFYPCPP